VVQGASGQTANLQNWLDASGAAIAGISPTGVFHLSDGTAFVQLIARNGAQDQGINWSDSASFMRNYSTGKISLNLQNYAGAGFTVNNSAGSASTVALTVQAVKLQT
jgi:hypothetical protein